MEWQSNFCYKSSKLSAETALQMDTHNRKSPLTESVVYMNGLHSRLKDDLTLTLCIENLIICKMQRLVSMECAFED